MAIFTKDGGYVVPARMMQQTLRDIRQKESQALQITRNESGVYSFDVFVPCSPGAHKALPRPGQQVREVPRASRLSNRFSILSNEDFHRQGRTS